MDFGPLVFVSSLSFVPRESQVQPIVPHSHRIDADADEMLRLSDPGRTTHRPQLQGGLGTDLTRRGYGGYGGADTLRSLGPFFLEQSIL